MTKSEELVYNLSTKSFLSLWCFPNPIREDNGKELCDVIIVNKPDILIISIKEIIIANPDFNETQDERWTRRAVDNSIKQVEGAVRTLHRGVSIKSPFGYKIPIQDINDFKIHRVCVAIGRGDDLSLKMGETVENFYHVFDEDSLWAILNELDTISDFIEYLEAKESKLKKTVLTTEKDLCAVYIQNQRSFPPGHDVIILEQGIWEEFKRKKEYQKRKEEDRISYIWDKLIQHFAKNALDGKLLFDHEKADYELPLRMMSRENRFGRRMLGYTLSEAIKRPYEPGKPFARLVESPVTNVAYVYLVWAPANEQEREVRKITLLQRCIVARLLKENCSTIIGIAVFPLGFKEVCEDLVYFCPDPSDNQWKDEARKLQNEYGYFTRPHFKRIQMDEFPL